MIGIDLGTTNSLIAYWQEASGENAPCARLIPNSEGSVLTPSAVSLSDTGTLLIGNAALQRRLTHPTLTATEFKRDMGSERKYQLGKTSFTPEQLSAFVLSSLKADAEAALNRPVRDVVISVPAYFNDTQRKATMVAAQLADLSVSRLINEPTAAALAYGLGDMLVAGNEDSVGLSQSTLVFDLGGGTFDVSIVDLFEGIIEIKASTGDNYLGGEDFTEAIARCIAARCELDEDIVTNGTAEQRARLRSVAERLKCELSKSSSVTGNLKLDGKHFEVSLSEADLESACVPLLERIRQPVTRAMRDARLNPETLDSIVLVGGTTRMPIVRKLVARLFGRFPETAVHPDHAIALGAATQAALIARDVSLDEVLLTDVSPFSLGIEHSSETSGGSRVSGLFSPIIERNVMIPASRVESYVTVRDNQAQLLIEIYQGEHRFVKDNVQLGSLQIDIPKRKAGAVQMDVRFTYDASGLLEVDVDVPGTDIQKSLSLLGNAARLSDKDIEKKRRELQQLMIHPRDDLPNRALLERADRLFSELSGHEREQVGESLSEFVAILETQDPHLIRTKRQAFADWLSQVERLL